MNELLKIGPIPVRTNPSDVRRFAHAISSDLGKIVESREVPFCFPARWMAIPEVKLHLKKWCTDGYPMLVRQTFDYERKLELDEDYLLEVSLSKKPGAESDFEIKGMVSDQQGDNVVTAVSLIRIFKKNMSIRT